MTDLLNATREAVLKHHQTTIDLSNNLADNPEISSKEFESSRKMVEILKKAGFETEYPFAGYDTAFCGVLDNGEGPSVAIMVEYDALPGIGHGCGHNLHGSLSILTALALTELKDKFKGKVYVVGTPAEEEDGAKTGMSDAGVFDGMSIAMMMHSICGNSQPDMPAFSLRCYDIDFIGETSHASASPWGGRNALTAARKFLDLLDAWRPGIKPEYRMNGIIVDGGTAVNIIPGNARVRIEFRTTSMSSLEKLDEIVLKCANASASVYNCKMKYQKALSDFADMVCVKTAQDAITEILESLGETVDPVMPPLGSTDVGNVSYRCPAIQPLISIAKQPYAWHTVEFEQATRTPEAFQAMSKGAQALALLALKVFNDDDYRQKLEDDFAQQIKIKKGE